MFRKLTERLDIDFALQAAGLGVWELDPATNQVLWDDRCRELFGLAEANLLSYEQAIQHIHPDDVHRVNEAVRQAMTPASDGHYDITYRIIGADDKRLRWVRFSGRSYFTDTGAIYRFAGVAQDVTQQMQSQQKLVSSEKRFRSLIERAPVATALFVGPTFVVEEANDQMILLWGKGVDVLGRPLIDDILPELKEQPFAQILADVYRTGEPYQAVADRCELIINGQPEVYYFNFTYQPLLDDRGKVYAILDMAIDVTAQVMVQQQLQKSETKFRNLSGKLDQEVQLRTQELAISNEQLLRSNEKLETNVEELHASYLNTAAANDKLSESNHLLKRSNESLEQFAYIASHDLQEPLRKIQSFGQLLQSQYGDKLGEGVGHLQRMQNAASRMSVLIRDLLSYSRISNHRDTNARVDLTSLLEQVLTDLDMLIDETGATVTMEGLPTVVGDGLQLGQLFLNLISNALKFRRDDVPVQIRLTAQLVAASDLPAQVQPAQVARSYHRINVTDNGIGFEQKYADRIFQVFQRLHSKDQYVGTGIGLAICEKVAANHGGGITASSQPGEGTTFSVYLPVVATT